MMRAAVALAALLTYALQPDPSPTDLAVELQRKYDAVRDFSADFEHTYTGAILKRQLTERGRMLVKKPGKMRWEYTAPEKKTLVSDGSKFYWYQPADKQVFVTSLPQGNEATTPLLFLAGQGNLTRDFTTMEVPPPPPLANGTRAVRLVPKVAQPDFESLLLTVDARSLTLKGLESTDAQGGRSRFIFINLKENVGLADNEFTFVMPRGVDVVTDDPRRRSSGGGPGR